jgi:hypothetical protein
MSRSLDERNKENPSPSPKALTGHFWTVCHFFDNVKVISEAVPKHNVISVQVAFGIVRIGCSSNI